MKIVTVESGAVEGDAFFDNGVWWIRTIGGRLPWRGATPLECVEIGKTIYWTVIERMKTEHEKTRRDLAKARGELAGVRRELGRVGARLGRVREERAMWRMLFEEEGKVIEEAIAVLGGS